MRSLFSCCNDAPLFAFFFPTPDRFYAHGYCFLWNKGLVALHVISDSLIALSYFAIPIILLWLIRKRRDLPFSWMFALFGIFIISCGITNLMEVWNLWHAQYWLAGAIKGLTAAASVSAAVLLVKIVPDAVDLPSPRQWIRANAELREQIQERQELELNLRLSEARYRETAELLDITHDAIFARNSDDKIIFWNRAAERLYGWQREEVLGSNSHELLHTEFLQPFETIRARLSSEGFWEGELTHTRRDGRKVIVSSRWAVQTGSGKLRAILESNRDITQRKHDETKFRNLLEAAPDAMVITNKAGIIQIVNSQTECLFGYQREEILGQPVEILIPHRFHAGHMCKRLEFAAHPRTRPMGEGLDLSGRRKDGTEFSVEISLSPIQTAEGVLMSSAIRDITQRKLFEARLHEQEVKLRLFLSGVVDYAVFLLDPFGNVTTWNAGAQQIKGYSANEIIGHNFSRFYTPEDVAAGKPRRILRQAAELGRYEEEGWRVRKDGSQFWASVVLTALYDSSNQLTGFGKVTRDMTHRKQIEEKLEQQTCRLALSNTKLVELNKELESFSYSVSHDLRAPLRAIDGFSVALLEDCAPQLDDTGKDHLNRIRAATQRMGVLIDDLLNLSRITRSELHFQKVDLSALVRSITSNLQKTQHETQHDHQVEFTIQDGLSANADSSLLRVALENLLNNAWKFTSKVPAARIEFGLSHSNGVSTYYVRDNGAGFDPRYTDRLFGAFQRLHSVTEFPGTGVGLATVQRIIRRHGGKIWAEGSLGKGAAFYFTLAPTTAKEGN